MDRETTASRESTAASDMLLPLATTGHAPNPATPTSDVPLPLAATRHAQAGAEGDESRPAAGDRLGRFTLLAHLGEGGMGVVFSAYDEQLDRRVAIKLLHAQAGGDEAFMLREAQAMARLQHPNIATVYEVGSSRGRTFMAMEFIRGSSLGQWVQAAPRSWQDVVRVMLQAARGLAAAHAAGLIHRDFKPANLLVGDDGVVKVVDFGLARADVAEPDDTGLMIGTPAYMAPEQHHGATATAASDQFSFCVTLYEVLYGQRPFAGDTLTALVEAVARGAIRPPPATAGVPSPLWSLIQRGLSVDPARRFPAMPVLVAALRRTLEPRRWPWLLASGLGIALLAAGAGMSVRSPDLACADAGASDAWSPAIAEGVATGLLTTRLPYAAATWDRVRPRLDAYAAELAELRREGCLAHAGGRMSARLFDRRTVCLDRREAAFVALTGLFGRADADIVRNAATAAAALPPLAACTDVRTLEDGEAASDPAIAAAVESAGQTLGEALAHEIAGDFRRGLEIVEGVAREAPAYAPLQAEIGLRRGSLLIELGEHEAADGVLGAALTRAIGADADLLAAAIATKRGFVRGARLQRPRDVLAEEATVAGLVDRVAALQGGLLARSDHLNNLGIAHGILGDARTSRDYFRQSLALRRDALGDEHPQVVYAMANLGMALTQGQDLVASADVLRSALRGAAAGLGPDHPHVALVAINLGDALRLLGRFHEAEAALDRALKIQTDLLGPDAVDLRYVLTTRGLLAIDRWDYADALADYTRVLALLEDGTGVDAAARIYALIGLGYAHTGVHDFGLAHTYLERAHATAERSVGSGTLVVAEVDEALGWMHLQAGDAEQALAAYRRAQAVRFVRLAAGDVLLGQSHRKIAEALAALGHHDEAALELDRAREIVEAAVPVVSMPVATIHHQRGDLELARGALPAARAAYARAIAIYTEISEPDLRDLAFSRFGLAKAAVDSDAVAAVAAAEQALATLRDGGDALAIRAAEVEAWLAAHRTGRRSGTSLMSTSDQHE